MLEGAGAGADLDVGTNHREGMDVDIGAEPGPEAVQRRDDGGRPDVARSPVAEIAHRHGGTATALAAQPSGLIIRMELPMAIPSTAGA